MNERVPPSNEVLLEPLARNVRRWNSSARGVEDLDHVVEQLIGSVEALVKSFDLLIEVCEPRIKGATVDLLQQSCERGSSGDNLLAEATGVEVVDPLKELRLILAHTASLIAQARAVKPSVQAERSERE